MVKINECRISNDAKNLFINAEVGVGYFIESITLWNEDTFKVYALKKNIIPQKINNKEVLIISSESLGFKRFSGVYYLEFNTNEPEDDCDECNTPTMAVVTNLASYYRCALNFLKKANISSLEMFRDEGSFDTEMEKTMFVNTLIDGVNNCISVGKIVEANNLIKELKYICEDCSNCNPANSEDIVNCSDCSKSNIYN